MVSLARMMFLSPLGEFGVGSSRAVIHALSFCFALGLYLKEGDSTEWMKHRNQKEVYSSWTETEGPVHLRGITVS